jgi:oligosaccharide repeat unit polymerase
VAFLEILILEFMSTANPTIPAFKPSSLPVPAAAFELLGYLVVVGVGTLCFLLGWLQLNGAAVLTTLLLVALLISAWNCFNQGRHPCFLFLATLTLLQGGRLLSYCVSGEISPLRIAGVAPYPFDISRDDGGIALLCLALSAVCIYAPCRWNYRRIPPPADTPVRQYLPYLYLLFYATLPIQILKNYKYYQYVQQHGGYVYFWLNHGDIASSVPFLVRAVVLVSFPVFVAVFVFERRKKYLYVATVLYFAAASLVLLLGSRGGVFAQVLVLWYVAGIKSAKRRRMVAVAALALGLVTAGIVFQSLREGPESLSDFAFAPIEFVTLQGNSLDVTEVAIKYRKILAPYAGSYLWNELQDAFVPRDVRDYVHGRRLAYDVTVLLNPTAFSRGMGTAGSYLAEIYLLGGAGGVVALSLLIGGGLHLLYGLSRNALSLFVVAMVLPDIILMPRGQLLDWVSVLLRSAISIAILALGWVLYRFLVWTKPTPRAGRTAPGGASIG